MCCALTSPTSQYLKWSTTPLLASPHRFVQHLALWAGSKLWWRSVTACCNTSLRGPSTRWRRTALAGLHQSSARCSSRINICPQLGGMQKGPVSFSTARGSCSVVFQCMVGNGCTRAWRRWYTAAWKDYASVVTFWYENSCDSCLFCTRFGRTTVALKIHIGSILYILSFPSVRSLQQWKSKAYKVIHETSPLSDAEVSLYALYVN